MITTSIVKLRKICALTLCLSFGLGLSVNAQGVQHVEQGELEKVDTSLYNSVESSELRALLPGVEVSTSTLLTTPSYSQNLGSGVEVETYNVDDFASYEITGFDLSDVSTINGHLYLYYTNETGDQLYLVYDNDELVEHTLYDHTTDTVTALRGDNLSVETEFLASAKHVYEDDNEPSNIQSQMQDSRSVKTNFYPPEEDFPIYYHKVLKSERLACSALQNDYITFKAMESRYDYRVQTADFRSFGVTTSLTLIAAYLGGPVTLTVGILTGIGVVISATDTIQNAVKLYKSASYSYLHGWQGYAYDTTLQMCDVLVKRNLKSGEFTFVLNKNDEYEWGRSIVPSNTISHEELIKEAHSMFNSDLMRYNGVNMSFFSDLP